jgi:hypothetical protein
MRRRPVTVRSAPENQVRVPADCLAEMGFAEGGPASVQVSRGRLVLTAPREIREVQSELGQLARELESLRDRLAEVVGELPEPADAVLRAEMPADVGTDLLGTLEVVLNDDIDPAIQKLHAAATVTDEQLRDHWRRNRPRGG